MAEINSEGNVIARCPVCDGGTSVFVYSSDGDELGVVRVREHERDYYGGTKPYDAHFRLFKCSGCGVGALGAVKMRKADGGYPNDIRELVWFYPEAKERFQLPDSVPNGIRKEFREAERCLEESCFRAAAALFRSVLDKALRHNGYKTKRGENLASQIDAATDDGIVTQSRRRRAHEDVRVLGNDVLHDEWRHLAEKDVQPAHQYVQRILEDFYDDRESVLVQLEAAGRKVQEPQTE